MALYEKVKSDKPPSEEDVQEELDKIDLAGIGAGLGAIAGGHLLDILVFNLAEAGGTDLAEAGGLGLRTGHCGDVVNVVRRLSRGSRVNRFPGLRITHRTQTLSLGLHFKCVCSTI
jgi:hypothetical protein